MKKESIAVDLLMSNVAFGMACQTLIKRHKEEWDRLYKLARKATDPSVSGIKGRYLPDL